MSPLGRISLSLIVFSFQVAWSSRIEIAPSVIEPGEEVTFVCQGDRKYILCVWEHGDGGIFIPGDNQIDKDDETACNFRMRVSDDVFSDNWECKLVYSQTTGDQYSGKANLTIAKAPKAPEIMVVTANNNEEPVSTGLTAVEGEEVHLVCYSKEGRPAAQISWTVGDAPALGNDGEDYPCALENETARSQPSVDSESRVVCKFRPEDNTRDLMCLAEHPFPVNGNETSVTLDVEFGTVLYTFKDQAYDGFLAGDTGNYQFYTVDVNTKVELKILIVSNPGIPSVTLEAAQAFGTLKEGQHNGRFSLKMVEKYENLTGSDPFVDRGDVFVATFVIDPTKESDFEHEYTFSAENEFCLQLGRECTSITFTLNQGQKVDNASGLSGGAIAGIVLACLAILIVILILVVAKMRRALCFGEQDLLRKLHSKTSTSQSPDVEDGGTINPATSIEKVNGNGHQVAATPQTESETPSKASSVDNDEPPIEKPPPPPPAPVFPELPKDTPV